MGNATDLLFRRQLQSRSGEGSSLTSAETGGGATSCTITAGSGHPINRGEGPTSMKRAFVIAA